MRTSPAGQRGPHLHRVLRLVPGQLFDGDVSKGPRGPVLLREDRRPPHRGPPYPDLRVVPEHVSLGAPVVLRRALVGEECLLCGDEEAVGEAFGDVELAFVL